MCGIAGIFNLSNKSLDQQIIKDMINKVNHRGPDYKDFYFDNLVSLGHARLSIIDLTNAANQPFYWEDRYIVVFNGEIYNYIEIKEELMNKGICFKTNSDTEVLLASYAYWGEDCQKRFNGMWAFIIWDKYKKKLFVSRDRFGIKPLYWYEFQGKYYFSSEIKQLTFIGANQININELSNYLYGSLVSCSDNTFFKNIQSLKGGHSISIQLGEDICIKQWYSLSSQLLNHYKDKDIIELIEDSVKLRMRSDVKLGSCLSGGIDSSTIANIFSKIHISKNNNFDINLIHAKSIDIENDESDYAIQASNYAGQELKMVIPTAKDFWDNIYKICYLQDEPFGSPSIFMQYFVMKKAKELGCKVMLDGQGADEILLGYHKYISLIFYNEIKNINFLKITKFLKDNFYFSENNSLLDKAKYIAGPIFSSLRTNRLQKRLNFLKLPIDSLKDIYKEIGNNSKDMKLTQILEVNKTSLPALLRYEDRNSMANSIEARVPFLDHRVVESSISLNLEDKIKNGWTKYPLRNSNLLPNSIAWRRSKLGFNAPERTWIGQYDNDMKNNIMSSEILNEIVDKNSLIENWRKLNYREKWRLFNTSIWAEIMKIKL